MEQVKIGIPGHPRFSELEFSIKSEWSELSFDDLLVAQLMVFTSPEDYDLNRGKLFSQLVQLPKKDLRELSELLMGDDDGVSALVQFYDIIDFTVTKRPVFNETKAGSFKDYRGPDDLFENIQWRQFAKAELFFHDYLNQRDDYSLNCLLSYMYWKDEFRPERASNMYKVVEGWTLNDRRAMFLNYMAIRNSLLSVPEVEEECVKEQERDPLRALMERAEDAAEQASKLPFKIAGEKIGTVDQINKMLVPDVLDLLDQMNEQ